MHKRTNKHALQLVCVLKATSLREFRDHTRLALVRCRNAKEKTLRQFRSVEPLEHILVIDVLEKCHDLIECSFQILLLRKFFILP